MSLIGFASAFVLGMIAGAMLMVLIVVLAMRN